MPALAGEVQVLAFGVERHAQLDQPVDRMRRAFDHEFDRFQPVEPGAGDHGVADMVLEGVTGIEHCGDTALRPGGRAAIGGALGQDQHLAGVRQRQRRGQSRRA